MHKLVILVLCLFLDIVSGDSNSVSSVSQVENLFQDSNGVSSVSPVSRPVDGLAKHDPLLDIGFIDTGIGKTIPETACPLGSAWTKRLGCVECPEAVKHCIQYYEKKECVDESKVCHICDEGYFKKENENICEECEDVEYCRSIGKGCTHLNTKSCLACNPGFLLDENKCLACSKGTVHCGEYANVCFDKTSKLKCSSCDPGYILNEESNSCIRCTQSVENCDPANFIANSCFSAEGEAICKKCNAGYYLDTTTNKCFECAPAPNCEEKAVSSVACIAGKNQVQCAKCAEGYYNNHGQCMNCEKNVDNCAEYTDRCGIDYFTTSTVLQCKACQKPYRLVGNKCISCGAMDDSCLKFFEDSCICQECKEGLIPFNGICKECEEVENCKNHNGVCYDETGILTCTQCNKGFDSDGENKCTGCEVKQFLNTSTNKCEDCTKIENCKTEGKNCYGKQTTIQCLECDSGYYINSEEFSCQKCKKDVHACEEYTENCHKRPLNFECKKCKEGYKLNSEINYCECTKEVENCELSFGSFCDVENEKICFHCKPGYALGYDYQCHECIKQTLGCKSYLTTCFEDKFAINYGLKCDICANGYIISKDVNQCIKCKKADTKCMTYSTNCFGSTPNLVCTACKDGYSYNSFKNICEECVKTANCDVYEEECPINTLVLGCKTCIAGYYVGEDTKECLPCAEVKNCKNYINEQCTSEHPFKQCNECESGLLLDKEENVCRGCDQGYQKINGVCVKCIKKSKCEVAGKSCVRDQGFLVCKKCEAGYYYNAVDGLCDYCRNDVLNCAGEYDFTKCINKQNVCLKAKPGYVLESETNSISTKKCQQGYHMTNGYCSKCEKILFCDKPKEDLCFKDTNALVCLNCKNGFKYNQHLNSCNECLDYFFKDLSGVCQPCKRLNSSCEKENLSTRCTYSNPYLKCGSALTIQSGTADQSDEKTNTHVIAGVAGGVVGLLVVIALFGGIWYYRRYKRTESRKKTFEGAFVEEFDLIPEKNDQASTSTTDMLATSK